MTPRPRGRFDPLLIAVAAATLGVLLVAPSSLRPVDLLGIGAALLVAMAALGRDRVRGAAQASILVVIAVSLALEQRDAPPVEALTGVLGPLGLVGAVTVLAGALAGDLEDARRGAAVTRRHLASRAELLDAVRTLVHSGRGGAAHVTVEALRELGSDAAAVALVIGDELVPREVVGLDWTAPLPVGSPSVARMLAGDGAQVFEDYRNDPARVVDVGLGTVIVVPIRFDGRAQGVVVSGRRSVGRPAEGDVEAAEVLAGHLGAALAAERSERHQDQLLTRLRELEALRSGFVDRVSEDLRDPLTIVRGIAQTLVTHGDRLDDDQRQEMVWRLTVQADDLGATLEALLDFSRLQVHQGEPTLVRVDVRELLEPAFSTVDVVLRGSLDGVVVVDPDLVRRSLDLLRGAALTVPDPLEIVVSDDEISLELRLPGPEGLEGGFARALAEQLLVSAGGRGERTPTGFRLRLPRATDEVTV